MSYVFDAHIFDKEERPPDQHELRAVLRNFFNEHRDRVFTSRQVEVPHEREFFHWVSNKAVRDLVEEDLVREKPGSECTSSQPIRNFRFGKVLSDPGFLTVRVGEWWSDDSTYLAFWHRFVAMIRASGSDDLMAPHELWDHFVAPGINDYMGPMFESVCRDFVGRSQHPRLPFRPVRVGEWWSDDSSEQTDVVALGTKGQVLLGECKWGSVTVDDVNKLNERRDAVLKELKGVTRVYVAVFAGNAIADRQLKRWVGKGDVLHFSPDDLFLMRQRHESRSAYPMFY